MLTINKIFDKVLSRSGNYILRQSNIELDVDRFRQLVSDALETYNEFVPFHKEYTIDLEGTRQFTFTADYDPDIGKIPDWISVAYPIRSAATVYAYFPQRLYSYGYYGTHYQSEILSDPILVPWTYDENKHVLHVPYNGYYKVVAVFRHTIDQTNDPVTNKPTFSISTVDDRDQAFIKLCLSLFLIGIGRSRRAFTLQELPVLMDAADLVQEGKDLWQEVLDQDLQRYQKFYLAYGE